MRWWPGVGTGGSGADLGGAAFGCSFGEQLEQSANSVNAMNRLRRGRHPMRRDEKEGKAFLKKRQVQATKRPRV